MSRSFWFTITLVLLSCASVITAQAFRNAKLRKTLSSEKHAVSDLEVQLGPLASPALSPFDSLYGPARGSIEAAAAESRASVSSEERIATTSERLTKFTATINSLEQSPAGFFKILPDILRIVQDLTPDEMIRVAETIDGKVVNFRPDGNEVARMILLLLAAEHDPLAILQNAEFNKNSELRQGVLGTVARKDPVKAKAWLDDAELTDRERERFQSMILSQMLKTDINASLVMMRESNVTIDMSMGINPIPEEQLPAMVEALDEPENAGIKDQIIALMLGGALAEGGVEAAKQHAAAANLSPENLSLFFQTHGHRASPNAMLEWIFEIQSTEEQLYSVPHIVGRWANKDFNAAGKWLGDMPPSRIKDAAIGTYAQTVMRVDPTAAMAWTEQIQNTEIRQSQIHSNARYWKRRDPDAANAWLEEKGIELPEIEVETAEKR